MSGAHTMTTTSDREKINEKFITRNRDGQAPNANDTTNQERRDDSEKYERTDRRRSTVGLDSDGESGDESGYESESDEFDEGDLFSKHKGNNDDDEIFTPFGRLKQSGILILFVFRVVVMVFLVCVFCNVFLCFSGMGIVPAKITVRDHEMESSNETESNNNTTVAFVYFSEALSTGAYIRYTLFRESVDNDDEAVGLYTGILSWRLTRFFFASTFYFTMPLLPVIGPVGYGNFKAACFGKGGRVMYISIVAIPALASLISFYSYFFLYFFSDESDRLAHRLTYVCRTLFCVAMFGSAYSYAGLSGVTRWSDRAKFATCLLGPSIAVSFVTAIVFPRYIMPTFATASEYERSVMALVLPNGVFFMLFVFARLAVQTLETRYGRIVERPETSCILPAIVAIFWSRILVAGNQPRAAIAGTSTARRLPLLYTSISAAALQFIARITANARDRLFQNMLSIIFCCRTGKLGSVSPADGNQTMTSKDARIAPKGARDCNDKADVIDARRLTRIESEETVKTMHNVVFIDIICEFSIILWLPLFISTLEVAALATSLSDAAFGYIISALAQLLPEVFFAWVYCRVARIPVQGARDSIARCGVWVAVLFATGGVVSTQVAVPGITANFLGG
eukprot:g4758.t1